MKDLLHFCMQVLITFVTMGTGIAIFFTSDDDKLKMTGLGLITTCFGAWVTMGSQNRKKKKLNPTL